MAKRKWQVWTETDKDGKPLEKEIYLCEGSHTKCLAYYKKHGGAVSDLHLGYDLGFSLPDKE